MTTQPLILSGMRSECRPRGTAQYSVAGKVTVGLALHWSCLKDRGISTHRVSGLRKPDDDGVWSLCLSTSSYTKVTFSALTPLAAEQEGIQPKKCLPTNPKGSRFGDQAKVGAILEKQLNKKVSKITYFCVAWVAELDWPSCHGTGAPLRRTQVPPSKNENKEIQ